MTFQKSIILFLGLFCFSCSITKLVPEQEKLIKSATIEFVNPEQVHHPKKLKPELYNAIKPNPQYGLGKSKLWVYYKNKPKKEKGLKSWFRKNFGEAPIYYQKKAIERNRLLLQRTMRDKGYLGSTITADTTVNGKFMAINYQIKSKGQYTIRSINYPSDSIQLQRYFKLVRRHKGFSKNAVYEKEKVDIERDKIYTIIGRNGFLDFPKEAIQIHIDTAVGNKQVDIYFTMNELKDSMASKQSYLGETFVYSDYSLENTQNAIDLDTISRKNFKLIQSDRVLKPKALERILTSKKGHLTNYSVLNKSITRLLDLGVFKYVNTKYEKRIANDSLLLDRYFYLTPALTEDIIGEFQINNRTGNFFGSNISGSYVHRNLASGAERLDLTLSSGIETQLSQNSSFINTLDLNAEVKLTFPRFLSPFRRNRTYTSNKPVTSIKLANGLQQRKDFFTLNVLSSFLTYDWKENERIRHSVTPIRIYWVNLVNTTATFNQILDADGRLAASFKDVFIAGMEYSYVLNNQKKNNRRPYVYANAKLGSSGNIVSLFSKKSTGANSNELFGVPYAQYIKFNPEIRYYIPRKEGLFASRFTIGAGFPYGNSDELPYIEQFFVGGSNSIRAFRLRTLGPGNFFNGTALTNNQFLDQTGDIKMELNLEYRGTLFGYLKGAIFLDAGNIWLLKSTSRPEGVFALNTFYKQIAVGTGVGLRFDVDFFVARLDVAFPIHEPINSNEFQWTYSYIRLFNKAWREQKLVWNLAIGYPF